MVYFMFLDKGILIKDLKRMESNCDLKVCFLIWEMFEFYKYVMNSIDDDDLEWILVIEVI